MAGEPTAADGMVTCPDCGRQSPADRLLCDCGYPLEFEQRRHQVETVPSVTRSPGERDDDTGDDDARDDDTAELPPVVDDPPSALPVPTWHASPTAGVRGELTCASCGERNPPERTWCARCGHRLRPEPVTAAATPAAPPPRRSPVPVAVAAVIALLLAGVLGTLVWQLRERGDAAEAGSTPTPTPTATATADPGTSTVAGEPQVLDAARITVAASSTQTDDCSCDAARTLDGDPSTAWNHDGVADGDPEGVPPAGVTLTYTFDAPLHVVGLAVVNGYVRTSDSGEDLFAANQRVAEALLSGEPGRQTTVVLTDTPERQEVSADLGTTSTVTVEVRSTYPGNAYPDVALSEVQFLVAP